MKLARIALTVVALLLATTLTVAQAPQLVPTQSDSSNPKYDSDPNYVKGTELLTAGKTKAAIEQLRLAVARNPAHVQAHCNLGAALFTDGQVKPAIREFREALRLDSSHSQSRNNLAAALTKQGQQLREKSDLDGAIAAFRELLGLQPGNADVKFDLSAGSRSARRPGGDAKSQG
jgi:Flp pilus assembly protein TadD